MKSLILASLGALALVTAASAAEPVKVTTNSGVVVGEQDGAIRRFNDFRHSSPSGTADNGKAGELDGSQTRGTVTGDVPGKLPGLSLGMMFVVSSDETAAAAETPRAADMILRRGGVKKKALYALRRVTLRCER